jgi:predicted TIM-barrel enzyme
MNLRTTFPAMVAIVVLVVGWTLGNATGTRQTVAQDDLIYNDTYSEVIEAVRKHAQASGIRLVLRASDGPIDPDNQKSVLSAVNRMIVYQDGLDITDAILQRLNAEDSNKSPT